MINGIINVYKEKGFTSHDVVAKLRGIAGQRKIGHTGTLDPEAEGVLPVCLGNATKLCGMLTDERKEYTAKLLLGVTTDTLDMTGNILKEQEVLVNEEQVKEAVSFFLGGYEQIPPMYSALKVNGKKLYELARQGKEVERKARRVELYALDILSIELPVVCIRVECSKGTYIRSLCQDIGERLGCGGAMSSLIRSRVGRFSLEEAKKLSEIQEYKDSGRLEQLIVPVDGMFEKLPAFTVRKDCVRLVENGNALCIEHILQEPDSLTKEVRIYNEEGRFYGIYEWQENNRLLKPVKMFLEREE